MADTSYTYVYYFVPQDGDSEEHPNVFLIRKPPRSVTTADITEQFPLPGTYFFRFKQQYGKSYVWLDGGEGTRTAPQYQGKVVCKVSRLALTSGGPVAGASAGARVAPAATVTQREVVAPAPAPATHKRAVSVAGTGKVGSGTGRQAHVRRATVAAVPAAAVARKVAPHVSETGRRLSQDDLLGLFDDGAPSATSTPVPTSFSPRGPAAAAPAPAGAFRSAAADAGMSTMGSMGNLSGGSRTPPLTGAGSISHLAAGIAGHKSPAPGRGRKPSGSGSGNILTGSMWG